jgi:hypothetical protein
MKVDLYTKAVLTIIAATLVWLTFGGRGFTTTVVQAQDRTPSRVIVVGWEDPQGYLYKLPGGDRNLMNSGLPLPVIDRLR